MGAAGHFSDGCCRPSEVCDRACGRGGGAADSQAPPGLAYETSGTEGCEDAQAAGSWGTPSCLQPQRRLEETVRGQFISDLFRALDVHDRGRLAEKELLAFAEHCGFKGGLRAWVMDYEALCREHGWDHIAGLTALQFAELVDDSGGRGYCSDKELLQLFGALGIPPPPAVERAVRDYTVGALFRQLARPSSSGWLREPELRRYADLCGYRGSAAEWAEEYRRLCGRQGWDPEAGVPAEGFAGLVGEPHGPAYSSDRELQAMLAVLRRRPGSRSRSQAPARCWRVGEVPSQGLPA